MNTKILSVLFVASIGIAACDKIAPPAENSAAQPAATAAATTPAAATPAAFAPRLLTAPMMGVYTPDFSYSVRSGSDNSAANGGKSSIAIEFWGLTVDEAEKRVRDSLVASGFEVKAQNSGNGAHSVRYAKPGSTSEVLVNVSPMGSRKRTAPDSVGTIYFEWMN